MERGSSWRGEATLDEIYVYLGRIQQPKSSIHILFHVHANPIYVEILDRTSLAIYNALINNRIVRKEDIVLIYCSRKSVIQPIVIIHTTSSRIFSFDDDIRTMLLNFLIIDRIPNQIGYAQKLMFNRNMALVGCCAIEFPYDESFCNALKNAGEIVRVAPFANMISFCSTKRIVDKLCDGCV